MTIKKTYKDYKEFFEEVNRSNDNKTYHYSYILLFSFLENRVQRIFEEQIKISYRRKDIKIKDDLKRESLFWKLSRIDKWGLNIPQSTRDKISIMNKRRNVFVHEALFNIVKVNEEDVGILYDICRSINRLRERQRKNPQELQKTLQRKKRLVEKRKELRLKLYGRLPM
jgi:hypothetical protein